MGNVIPVYAEGEGTADSGFKSENGNTYYYENGARVTGERYIVDESGIGYWYYFIPGTGGVMDTGWSYIPEANKWCYYDENGRRLQGEQYIDNHWYFLDSSTGAVSYGFQYIEKYDKWVFYDRVMGWMLYGEQCIDDGWYYLDPVTGAVDYEWAWIPDSGKWVYYDAVTGRMQYGEQCIDGKWEYFDRVTGRADSKQDKINKVVAAAYSAVGKHPDCPGLLAANGGELCHWGPCMSFVWWMFYQADLNMHLAEGLNSGWPHKNYEWYLARGMVDNNPQVGDIVFFWYWQFAGRDGVSCSHAGLVVDVKGDSVLVIDAKNGGIAPRWYSMKTGDIVGFAHPWD